MNPVKSEGGHSNKMKRASLLNNTNSNGGGGGIHTSQMMPHNNGSKASRLSTQKMTPDERSKIQELRKKISEATKSNHGG